MSTRYPIKDVEKTAGYQSLDLGDLQRYDWRYKSINHEGIKAIIIKGVSTNREQASGLDP